MLKHIRKIAKISNIIYAIILLSVSLLMFKLTLYREKPITLFHYSAYTISTPSMEPIYKVNSVVIVKKINFQELCIGDVIVFQSDALGKKLAFHRIISITPDGIYTKGDNNTNGDNQLITINTYIGKCVLHSNLLVNYINTIKSFKGMLLYLVMPLSGIITLTTCIRFIKNERKNNIIMDDKI